MKTCPNCGSANRDDALTCYACGTNLYLGSSSLPASGDPGRTQPVRRRAADAAPPPRPTGPLRNYPTDPSVAPGSAAPAYSQPNPSLPPDSPMPSAGYGPGYAQPEFEVVDAQPEPPPQQRKSRSNQRFWSALVVWLVIALACGSGLALWTIGSTAANGVRSWGQQVSTQAAEVVAPLAPQDTATPQPAQLPEPQITPTLDPTQESLVRRLLSPECSAALDHLDRARDQFSSQPTAPLTQEWRDDLDQAVTETRTACGSLESASPAPGLIAQAQEKLAAAQSEFDEANRLFKEGVDEWNPGKVWEATGHLRLAGDDLDQAIDALKQIGST